MVGEWPLQLGGKELRPCLRRQPCASIKDVVNTTSIQMRGFTRARGRHVRIVPPVTDEQRVCVVGRRDIEITEKNTGQIAVGDRRDLFAAEYGHREGTVAIEMGIENHNLLT